MMQEQMRDSVRTVGSRASGYGPGYVAVRANATDSDLPGTAQEIPSAMGVLDKEISDLKDAVLDLERRLAPVLRPTCDAVSVEEAPDGLTPLGSIITTQAWRVATVDRMVRSICARLGLD